MYWLVDNADFWYVLLAMVGLGFGAAWWVQRWPKHLLGAAAALGLIALLWLLTQLVVTDRKQLELNIRAMADAVVEGKADVLLKHFAGDFQFQGRQGKALADWVTREAKKFQVSEIAIPFFDVEELKQGSATAYFRAIVHHAADRPFPIVCRALFIKESDHWKVREIRLFDLQDRPLPIP